MATNVRIQSESYQKLRAMAAVAGKTMPDVLAAAIDRHYRSWMLEGLAQDYERLRKDKKAWTQEQQERALWDRSLPDGLKDL